MSFEVEQSRELYINQAQKDNSDLAIVSSMQMVRHQNVQIKSFR